MNIKLGKMNYVGEFRKCAIFHSNGYIYIYIYIYIYDAVWSKEVPFGVRIMTNYLLGSVVSKTVNIFASEGKSQLKIDCSITF